MQWRVIKRTIMKNKLAIIGSGLRNQIIEKLFAEKGIDDISVVTLEEAKKIDDENMELRTDYLELNYIKPPEINLYGNKSFVCKGKHQYRPIEKRDGNIIHVEWVCQCGRKL